MSAGEARSAAHTTPRNGVWGRGPRDWAYRVEVEGYGSIAGAGFASRDEARARMEQVRREAESEVYCKERK